MRPQSEITALLLALSAASSADGEFAMTLQEFLDAVMHAHPATLSVTLTVHRHGLPVIIAVEAERAGSSVVEAAGELTVPLPRRRPGEHPAVLCLQSSDSRALGQLRADLLSLLDLDPRRATLTARTRALDPHSNSNPDEDPLATHPVGGPGSYLDWLDSLAGLGATDAALLGRELDDVTAVDRALGVLLDRGFLPPDGLAELTARSLASGDTLPATAMQVIAEARRPARAEK